MTNISLARSYLLKVQAQLEVLPVLMAHGAYSNVVRGAQEVVELALKAMLRHVAVDPPKWHDVGSILAQYRDRFPPETRRHIDRLATISADLRKDRELAFYGDVDLIPTEHYTQTHAEPALESARFAVTAAADLIGQPPSPPSSPEGPPAE